MNVTEAAKAAGWTQTAIDMASKQEIERLERFAKIITNQALEDAAMCCDEYEVPKVITGAHPDYLEGKHMQKSQCAHAIRAMKKDTQ